MLTALILLGEFFKVLVSKTEEFNLILHVIVFIFSQLTEISYLILLAQYLLSLLEDKGF